ncbi:sulfur carrier protein ThiS [Phytoactinopolyspora alkaliphila]|uniref:Sulfur carrier protein ThiS n=1 Tax=Phytoactinopolyspora alkaliphila TaxID=1783498 RepID=A0A6N9YL25_9ACTN|nr:sulfur carrier protein ThiS [Phytoactinopolyspora alkaliphila]NED95655.1 sulfur carrier protein ThiS [Phytoactinopolyspora alkaliphila]
MATTVKVNGEEIAFDGPASVSDVVDRALDNPVGSSVARGIAVAVNNDVVPRGSWRTTRVSTGDHVEILTATQGG